MKGCRLSLADTTSPYNAPRSFLLILAAYIEELRMSVYTQMKNKRVNQNNRVNSKNTEHKSLTFSGKCAAIVLRMGIIWRWVKMLTGHSSAPNRS